MSVTRIVRRERAERDIDEATERYFEEGGLALELRFIDALEAAMRHVAAHGSSGSPRYAGELNMPGLRTWPLKRFPYLVFYIEHDDCIDVLRVLHSVTNIPAWLTDSGDGEEPKE
jgi:toxin ParE1/3/4